MVDRADTSKIAELIAGELQWLVHTEFLQKIILAELGLDGIGTDEAKDGADAG
jgi:hypothetical protein